MVQSEARLIETGVWQRRPVYDGYIVQSEAVFVVASQSQWRRAPSVYMVELRRLRRVPLDGVVEGLDDVTGVRGVWPSDGETDVA